MNLIRIVLISLIIMAFASANAQTIKPKFKRLIIADYEIDTIGNHQHVNIKQYQEINENGQMHLQEVNNYGISDTTYVLPDSTIVKLNSIFNGNNPLKSFMITDKLPEGHHFGGPLSFLSCTYWSNLRENFIWVYPFMNQMFKDALAYSIKWPKKIAYRGNRINNPGIEGEILKWHNACKYIPKIEQPPPIMDLPK